MSSDLHSAWARLLVGSLRASGVEDFVVSPGSRSTPLALAIASLPEARAHVVVDERAAAFFALGQARASGRPSALVCTSGSAGAHYLPAIVEASQSDVPLVVVTADRPWELVDCAASQTIDQAKLFGGFVRWFADVAAPDPSPSALRGVTRVAAQAVARASSQRPGPVHVNARFRKPLEPCAQPAPEAWEPMLSELRDRGPTRWSPARREPDVARVRAVARRLAASARAIVVAGPSAVRTAEERRAVFDLCERLSLPLFAEATSQLRFGACSAKLLRVGALDLVIGALGASPPDLVLQLGAPPISSAYAALAERAVCRVVVSPHAWADPQSSADEVVASDAGAFAAATLRAMESSGSGASRWAALVASLDAAAARVVDAELDASTLGEGEVARAVVAALPAGATLTIGNSSPVRDLDAWCAPGGAAIDVLHQRGAAGIDGLVAGAAGARAVTGAPSALLLGDVSFAHDIGGLALAPRVGAPLVVVVVDNGGGRIFEALPLRAAIDDATFERFFATPPTVDVALAARAYGHAFARVETPAALDRALADAFARAGTTVVHAITPKHAAAPRAARLRAAFVDTISKGAEP